MNTARLHAVSFRFLQRVLILGGMAAAWQSAPAASTTMPGYEIVRLGRGHLNRLTMAATVEGKKGLFVVDTGAGGTFLSAGKYSSLLPGGDRQLPSGTPKTASVNGTMVPVGYARDFHVGNSNLGSLPLRIVPQRYLYDPEMLYQTDKSHDYDGFIGEDILRHTHAILDAGRLLLYLNVDPARKTDPGRGLVAAGWTRVPMSDLGSDFTVECRLGDTKFRVIVDTGAPFTIFDKAAVDRAHAQVSFLPMRGGVVGTRRQEASLISAEHLAIGDYTATNVHLVSQLGLGDALRSNYSETAPVAGLLGGDILSKHNAIIDVGNKALYLRRTAPGAAAKP